jgi:hypothetical protein
VSRRTPTAKYSSNTLSPTVIIKERRHGTEISHLFKATTTAWVQFQRVPVQPQYNTGELGRKYQSARSTPCCGRCEPTLYEMCIISVLVWLACAYFPSSLLVRPNLALASHPKAEPPLMADVVVSLSNKDCAHRSVRKNLHSCLDVVLGK